MGKKFEAAKKQVPEHPLTIEDAIPLLQKVKFAKFDETVELTARLGVDPKHADQMVRGTVVLPHGLVRQRLLSSCSELNKTSVHESFFMPVMQRRGHEDKPSSFEQLALGVAAAEAAA